MRMRKWACESLRHAQLCNPVDYSPWNSPGQNTGVGSLSLLQGIFLIQGSNPGLPHCRQILYQLSHKGSPRILEWVAYSFSSRSSQPKNRTGVSCITDGFFTNWAIREAPWNRKVSKLQKFASCVWGLQDRWGGPGDADSTWGTKITSSNLQDKTSDCVTWKAYTSVV